MKHAGRGQTTRADIKLVQHNSSARACPGTRLDTARVTSGINISASPEHELSGGEGEDDDEDKVPSGSSPEIAPASPEVAPTSPETDRDKMFSRPIGAVGGW